MVTGRVAELASFVSTTRQFWQGSQVWFVVQEWCVVIGSAELPHDVGRFNSELEHGTPNWMRNWDQIPVGYSD